MQRCPEWFFCYTAAMISIPPLLITEQPAAHVLLVTLNRPEAANALSQKMGEEIAQCFASLPADTRAVIITGSGKHFCAGADLKERKGMSNEQWHTQHAAFEAALHALLDCPVPVIAAVNGAAYGGGLELALACDFVYASANARFALTETTLGIIPGMGGTQHLPRAAGLRRAKELIFTGTAFGAEDALRYGVANRVCNPESLKADALQTACCIAANAPLAIRAAKRAMRHGIEMPICEALACELTQYETLLGTKDRQEGINAFNEKRKPSFTGT
jgi:enoyl-CoA hydratase/carnithine racemase